MLLVYAVRSKAESNQVEYMNSHGGGRGAGCRFISFARLDSANMNLGPRAESRIRGHRLPVVLIAGIVRLGDHTAKEHQQFSNMRNCSILQPQKVLLICSDDLALTKLYLRLVSSFCLQSAAG